MKEIHLTKQQVLDDDLRAIQQNSFAGNLANNAIMSLLLKKQKKPDKTFQMKP